MPPKSDGDIGPLDDVVSSVRTRRAEIEQARRLPADLAEALRKTGIYRLGVPRAMGGREASPIELMRTIEILARADASTGWCVMTGIANGVIAGYMIEDGAREVFADPTLPTAGIAAPSGTAVRVSGGVRVSGRWAFASGIDHCRWLWAGCIVTENGNPRMTPHGPEIIHVCLPLADVVVHDTWHVSGLCGTGSKDFSAADVFVPERRIFMLLDPRGHRSEPLYQMPPLTLYVLQLACVSVGLARAALDELTELAQRKVPTFYLEALSKRPAAQIEIAKAEAALGGARAFLYATAEEMSDGVSRGVTPTKRQLALARAAATQVADTAAAIARTANVLAGGASVYAGSALQRHARDAEAITHHFTVAPHTWEQAGRVLLGHDPGVPAF